MPEALLDVLTLVSSDKRFPLELSSLMTTGEVRVVHTFRTGSECLRALSLDDSATRRLVLVDSLVSDISPANLCDALRLSYPSLSIVMVVGQDDAEGIQRAMLAGAKATITRQASLIELSRVLERVIEASEHRVLNQTEGSVAGQPGMTLSSGQNLENLERRAVLVPIIGARGGAGRSSLSSALAYLAAEAHIDTALIDFDLQFGDLSFLFGSTGQQTLGWQDVHHAKENLQNEGNYLAADDMQSFLEEVSQGQKSRRSAEGLRRFGRQLTPNLRLYAPRAVPEKTELLTQFLPAAFDRLRREHELLLVNTGAYWTLFHSELLEQSDLSICVLDQSIVGVRATIELRELCRRVGIPASRLLFVMNRVRADGLGSQDVAEVLNAEKVFTVHDAGTKLADLFDSGDFAQLLSQTPFMAELYEVLDEIAIRSDLRVHDAVSLRYAMRREGGARLLTPARNPKNKKRSGQRTSYTKAARRKGLLRRA
ncbi:MAG: hypothetical protein FWE48_00450 [Coriobacteriia bacterium]|nr:hypothetical protein [Coriobacteriia bacterium]MCL2745557.1 hypothetical protein [Coriobacteriia bacterium]MCL2870427.1 hypothetical protein [Coriobacteriia bacterium]